MKALVSRVPNDRVRVLLKVAGEVDGPTIYTGSPSSLTPCARRTRSSFSFDVIIGDLTRVS